MLVITGLAGHLLFGDLWQLLGAWHLLGSRSALKVLYDAS